MKKIMDLEMVVKTKRTIEVEEIEGTNFVFYIDRRIIDENGKKEEIVLKGITSKENVKETKDLDGISHSVYSPKMYGKKAYIMGIHKDKFKLVLEGKEHISYVVENIDINDLSIFENYMVVLWNESSFELADLSYNFIPTPISFGYSNGCIDNETYDLERLLEKLKKDTNVVNRENLEITSIPYYNADENRNKTIQFKYLLPFDIFQKIASMDDSKARRYILEEIIGVGDCKM